MKRLRDRTGPTSPLEATAIGLLSSVNRFETPPGAKQRVRARLLASRSVSRATIFRPAVSIAILLIAVGASAAIGGTWVVRRQLLDKQTAVHGTPSTIDASDAATTRPIHRAPDPPNTTSAAAEIEPQTTRAGDETPVTPTAANEKSESTITGKGGGSTRLSAKPSEEVKLVFDSMRALRRDGQPERASKQLDEYLKRYPNGALAEEALALSIEAAVQRGDPRAKDLATNYLGRYPSGQFKKAAERARARFSP